MRTFSILLSKVETRTEKHISSYVFPPFPRTRQLSYPYLRARAPSVPAGTAGLTGKIRRLTEHVLQELHRFTDVKYSEGRTSFHIFFPQPLFHFNCARDLRVPTARAFHAPQLIQRRAEKTRAWPLYSSPESDKLDLTPLNKREVWFRSGFYLPKGG